MKTCLPIASAAAAPVTPAGAFGGAVCLRFQATNCAGVTTWTVPRIVEWPVAVADAEVQPRSYPSEHDGNAAAAGSAHTIGNSPSLSGVIR